MKPTIKEMLDRIHRIEDELEHEAGRRRSDRAGLTRLDGEAGLPP